MSYQDYLTKSPSRHRCLRPTYLKTVLCLNKRAGCLFRTQANLVSRSQTVRFPPRPEDQVQHPFGRYYTTFFAPDFENESTRTCKRFSPSYMPVYRDVNEKIDHHVHGCDSYKEHQLHLLPG